MRIAVFVDYWNFQLTLNDQLKIRHCAKDYRAKVDWRQLGQTLAKAACPVLACDEVGLAYQGCYIYTSFDPRKNEGVKFKNWATTWLDRQPGINVEVRERKPKALPKCPSCHAEISHCPECSQPIVATIEKGIDTLLATDLIRLAVSDFYDAAVLASLDADMIPAVEFVQSLGKKVIQAGFPPGGVDLATQCWGSFNVMDLGKALERSG